MHNEESYHCRICGLIQGDQPWEEDGITASFELCGCCGVQFGYEDCTLDCVKKYRSEWLERKNKWFFQKKMPVDWSLEKQMEGIPELFK